jgi:hypothetical protein
VSALVTAPEAIGRAEFARLTPADVRAAQAWARRDDVDLAAVLARATATLRAALGGADGRALVPQVAAVAHDVEALVAALVDARDAAAAADRELGALTARVEAAAASAAAAEATARWAFLREHRVEVLRGPAGYLVALGAPLAWSGHRFAGPTLETAVDAARAGVARGLG